MRTFVRAGLLVSLITPSATALQPPSTAQATGLIRLLGSNSYEERNAAEKALKAMGKRAMPALQKAAKGARDAEVRRRAARLVQASTRDTLVAEQGRLRGTWEVVRLEAAGRVRPMAPLRYVFEDHRIVVRARDGNDLAHGSDGSYCVTAIGALEIAVPFVGTGRGIYRQDGDTLRLCVDPDGKRPKEFATRDGSALFLLDFKRVKP